MDTTHTIFALFLTIVSGITICAGGVGFIVGDFVAGFVGLIFGLIGIAVTACEVIRLSR